MVQAKVQWQKNVVYYKNKGREIEFTREPGGTDISEK